MYIKNNKLLNEIKSVIGDDFMNEQVQNLKGSNVTIGITGLPIVLTGEVISTTGTNVIGLKTAGGVIIYINSELIAFVY